MTYLDVQKFLDRHVIQYMAERDGYGGPLNTCLRINCFVNEQVTFDMARGILRSLTDRGYCRYARGLFTEDGEVAGSGYGLTQKGLEYYEELCPIDTGAAPQLCGQL